MTRAVQNGRNNEPATKADILLNPYWTRVQLDRWLLIQIDASALTLILLICFNPINSFGFAV